MQNNVKYSLRNINLKISKGECVGIIGKNGAGKSTLLKLICGITSPTEGKVIVKGKISSLLELGTGFNPEYNGISNIYLNGTIQGLSKKEIKKLIPDIASFADIGEYIEKPVKTYSDGMFLRLAFACATMTEPDILIVDEALAVGDFMFRQKCFNKIKELRRSGTTIIMVSHDIDTIRRLCPRTVWIENGLIKMDGATASVSASYMESMTGSVDFMNRSGSEGAGGLNRFGSNTNAIKSVFVPETLLTSSPAEIKCVLDIPEGAALNTLAVSLSFKNSFGLDMTVISSTDCGICFKKYGKCEIKINFVPYLCSGEYSLCVSLEDRGGNPIKYYDYIEGLTTVTVVSDREYFGVFHTPAEIAVSEYE